MSFEKAKEETFRLVVAAAVAGERCPQNKPHGPIPDRTVIALCEEGRLRSEVYRHNWRVVTVLQGEHRGKTTAPAPAGLKPYLVNGVHVRRLKGW